MKKSHPMIHHASLSSPLGIITISASKKGITWLNFVDEAPVDLDQEPASHILRRAIAQLKEYFAGVRTAFEGLPFDLAGSDFDRSVWKALLTTSFGKTVTYGHLASIIGREKAARAVGGAVGRNPVCILVPCHRILPSTGRLGGFSAGPERKKWLLAHEGASVREK